MILVLPIYYSHHSVVNPYLLIPHFTPPTRMTLPLTMVWHDRWPWRVYWCMTYQTWPSVLKQHYLLWRVGHAQINRSCVSCVKTHRATFPRSCHRHLSHVFIFPTQLRHTPACLSVRCHIVLHAWKIKKRYPRIMLPCCKYIQRCDIQNHQFMYGNKCLKNKIGGKRDDNHNCSPKM